MCIAPIERRLCTSLVPGMGSQSRATCLRPPTLEFVTFQKVQLLVSKVQSFKTRSKISLQEVYNLFSIPQLLSMLIQLHIQMKRFTTAPASLWGPLLCLNPKIIPWTITTTNNLWILINKNSRNLILELDTTLVRPYDMFLGYLSTSL